MVPHFGLWFFTGMPALPPTISVSAYGYHIKKSEHGKSVKRCKTNGFGNIIAGLFRRKNYTWKNQKSKKSIWHDGNFDTENKGIGKQNER